MLGLVSYDFKYINFVLSASTRWVLIAILFLYLILRKRLLSFFDTALFLVIFLYVLWSFFTSFWSDIPVLSFSKSILLIVIPIIMTNITIEWVVTHSVKDCLNYLSIFAFISVFTGLIGFFDPSSFQVNQGVHLYIGLTRSSNMFGSLLLMSLPYLLWKFHLNWGDSKVRKKWLFLSVSCFFLLFLTMTRASIFGGILVLIMYVFSLRLSKKTWFGLICALISAAILIINPSIITKFISKTGTSSSIITNILSSRHEPWMKSSIGAEQGGWFGLGYGISYGSNTFNFENGLTSVGYGREKGNSQLAIMEETGKIGLILYSVLLLTIAFKLMKLFVNSREYDHRVLIGIVSGVFFGMIFLSLFEAWWTAPGSAEFMYFWTIVGVIRGLEIVIGKRQVYYEAHGLEAKNRNGLAGAF